MILARDRLPTPYRDEQQVLAPLVRTLTNRLDWAPIATDARGWLASVRSRPVALWAVESLLKEYPISSAEGLALMRLAEALLRIPDLETAIALTADQLSKASFQADSGRLVVELSSTVIGLSRRFLPQDDGAQGLMGRLGSRVVVTAALRAVQLLGSQFVMGESIETALSRGARSRQQGVGSRYSFDMLGEGARTEADAARYLEAYQHAIRTIAAQSDHALAPEKKDGISIKLSALHPRFEVLQADRVTGDLIDRIWNLCDQAASANLNLTIDAEEVDRLEFSLVLIEAVLDRIAEHYPHWQGFGLAIQAYQTRAVDLVDHLVAYARRLRLRLMVRLVKGAYWDAEIKRTQEQGLPAYPVFTAKHHTDISYLACVARLVDAADVIFPQFATHNAVTIAAVLQMTRQAGVAFEFQRLHGMGEEVYREVLAQQDITCRVYAPVGHHRDLLAYLVRRLLENGANSSFVHQLADPSVSLDDLVRSPVLMPFSSEIPLPAQLYGHHRQNSQGIDLSEASARQRLQQAYSDVVVGVCPDTPISALGGLMARARLAQSEWSRKPVSARALYLRMAADRLQQEMPVFAALLVKEAKKSWADAVSEVREAIDFLRYYATEAEGLMSTQPLVGPTGESNRLTLIPRGVWVSISPWNFPLAIFAGQAAAALVTGNAVLCKPAEQTPVVATRLVSLLHDVGIPKDVLILATGNGETIGDGLVGLDGIAGVVFTGSTAVAKVIQRRLAAKDGPIIPLIAETGGVNAMVVDSTALPEQVVDAVIQSSFKSAGQRCSSLRLLCLHEEIADRVLEMLVGAASSLSVGRPEHWSTDVGPLIDEEARRAVQNAIDQLRCSANPMLLWSGHLETSDSFVAPAIFEISDLTQIRGEIFGPVLQVLRWRGDALDLIERINQLGFGLTCGLQTRIDQRVEQWADRIDVGNVYVNRNMIGAVVGVQPFGGHGQSGTGPKAGGPNYLRAFCLEKTVTINETALGGNVSLLAVSR